MGSRVVVLVFTLGNGLHWEMDRRQALAKQSDVHKSNQLLSSTQLRHRCDKVIRATGLLHRGDVSTSGMGSRRSGSTSSMFFLSCHSFSHPFVVPAENWDDDFEFSHSDERKPRQKHLTLTDPRLSVTSTHLSEDWDAEGPHGTRPGPAPVLGDKKNLPPAGLFSHLQNWAETGPSTPTKRSAPPAENWDDDFEDKAESPIHLKSYSPKSSRLLHHPKLTERENWDDDFLRHTPVPVRVRQGEFVESSDEEEDSFRANEEDRTVTARNRPILHHSPPPPVPPFPQGLNTTAGPFPGSPTVSAFSIPTSGRNSVGYMSTSHIALRPTMSGVSLAMLPPSPPIHRERRRLRKKSRPPNLDNNVFELVEEQRDSTPPLLPSTPERCSPSPLHTTEATPGNNKTPLLSRIGSVKKWGVRRKRASTGPAEVISGEVERTPRSRHPNTLSTVGPSATANNNSNTWSGWFFHPGGVPGPGSPPPATTEVNCGKNLGKHPVVPGKMADVFVPSTPTSKPLRKKQSQKYDLGGSTESAEPSGKPSLSTTPRRPISMQLPNGRFPSGSGTGTRHASYGSSVGRSSARVFSTPTPTESSEELSLQGPEGSRSFAGSVRKSSLVGQRKHKKRKSATEVDAMPPLPTTPSPMNRPVPQETVKAAELLPPIELHPPSPPRMINGVSVSRSAPKDLSDGLESLIVPSSSLPASLTPRSSSMTSNRASPKSPSSPQQSASLGRTAQVPTTPSSSSVLRRNSLGDLKIPARISQAQIGLKRDLSMVREFAISVDSKYPATSKLDLAHGEA